MVRLLDVFSARVLPIGAFLYVIFLSVWDVYFHVPFGNLAMRGVVLQTVGSFLVGFACLGPGWMWVTRFYPRYVKLRGWMYRASQLGGFVALVLLLVGVWALLAGIQSSVNIVRDLSSEPERRDGVVCTHFNPEIITRGKGGRFIGAFMEAYSQTAWRPVKPLVRAHLRKAVNKPHTLNSSGSEVGFQPSLSA